MSDEEHWHYAQDVEGVALEVHEHDDLQRDIDRVSYDLETHRHYETEDEISALRGDLDDALRSIDQLQARVRALENGGYTAEPPVEPEEPRERDDEDAAPAGPSNSQEALGESSGSIDPSAPLKDS